MHCAPFLLTMQIIFASVSYRRVVADLRDIKFHYKKNQGWREATGENRHVYIKNFRITVAGIQGGGVLWDKSFSTQGKIELPVCWISMVKAEDFNRKWSIECTGTIEHSVDGFPNTKRVDIW